MSESKRSRQQHTAEFKREAVLLVTEQGLSVAEASKRLGLKGNLLYRWKQEWDAAGAQAFAAPAPLSGVVSATVTFPLEVARRRMMVGATYPNTAVALATIARTEGASALFNGERLAWEGGGGRFYKPLADPRRTRD